LIAVPQREGLTKPMNTQGDTPEVGHWEIFDKKRYNQLFRQRKMMTGRQVRGFLGSIGGPTVSKSYTIRGKELISSCRKCRT
jgi:hypothetical protein